MKFINLAKQKNAEMENYKIDDKYFNLLTTETLNSLLSESNKFLSETTDSINLIINKANDIFKILVVILIALVGFFFTSSDTSFIQTVLSVYGILSIIMLLIFLYSIIYPKKIFVSGIEPQKIINDIVISKDLKLNDKRILFTIVQGKQRSINKNSITHEKILNRYKSIVK